MSVRYIFGVEPMSSVYPNLEKEIQDRHMSYSRLAKMIGLSKYAMYRRISGQTDFKVTEAVLICQILNNLDAEQLFLRLHTKT